MRDDDFTTNLTTLMIETFESPPARSSAYLDQRAGLFETLAAITAATASRSAAAGGTTVAAHTAHVRFYLDALLGFMGGRTEPVDWRESWQVEGVTSEAWSALQVELRAAYDRVRATLADVASWDDDAVADALAMLVHTAYHLGAIRQLLRVVGPCSDEPST